MSTLFYHYSHKEEFPITYLFMELLERSVEESPGCSLKEALLPVLKACGHPPPYSEEFLQSVSAALNEVSKEKKKLSEEVNKQKKPDPKPGLGTQLAEFTKGLTLQESLLYVYEYDFDKASHHYCNTPVQAVDLSISLKYRFLWQTLTQRYEACLFGFGGGYSDSKSNLPPATDANTHEVTDAASFSKMAAAAKSVGF